MAIRKKQQMIQNDQVEVGKKKWLKQAGQKIGQNHHNNKTASPKSRQS